MLEHKGAITINTERMTLRATTHEDEKALFDACLSRPEVMKYLEHDSDTAPNKDGQAAGFLANMARDYSWTIIYDGAPIGMVALAEVSAANKTGRISFLLSDTFWRNGYATEAVMAVFEYLFRTVGLNRIEGYHSTNNPKAGAVMRRCGMQFEGMMREKFYSPLGYQDANMYSILKSEYMRR